ncbi:RNA pyrophosphohydrolase [Sandarakinorhabdus sp.]|uniref:RNA pyrophosphohydrolase n=1 Tax=Sandarakinorhabdus sp. TaxID=1916663 RepID=UPI00286E167B|nr:RNA pyrophosphohydrolase [Sandarakinorhabdus sp.]
MTPTAVPRTHKSGLPYRPCVGVLLVNSQGLVFTGQRLDSVLEAWQMPQGGIDPGEEPLDTAIRELGEETGIAAHLVQPLGETPDWHYYDLPEEMVGIIWKGRYAGQRQKWFAMRFLGTDADVDIATEHQEFRAWRWSAIDTLVDMAVPFKRQLYTDVIGVLLPHL